MEDGPKKKEIEISPINQSCRNEKGKEPMLPTVHNKKKPDGKERKAMLVHEQVVFWPMNDDAKRTRGSALQNLMHPPP